MKCKICDSKKIFEVINLGKQPLANKYPKNKNEIIREKKFFLNILKLILRVKELGLLLKET